MFGWKSAQLHINRPTTTSLLSTMYMSLLMHRDKLKHHSINIIVSEVSQYTCPVTILLYTHHTHTHTHTHTHILASLRLITNVNIKCELLLCNVSHLCVCVCVCVCVCGVYIIIL